jgi:hypothetical protein
VQWAAHYAVRFGAVQAVQADTQATGLYGQQIDTGGVHSAQNEDSQSVPRLEQGKWRQNSADAIID